MMPLGRAEKHKIDYVLLSVDITMQKERHCDVADRLPDMGSGGLGSNPCLTTALIGQVGDTGELFLECVTHLQNPIKFVIHW